MPEYELTLRKNGVEVRRVTVGARTVVIGRSSKSDFVIPDNVISREHARIKISDGQVIIEDLGSTNGIAINGQRVTSSPVEAGDTVSIGKYTLLIERKETQGFVHESGSMLSFEAADAAYDRMIGAGSSDPLPILYRAAQLMGTQTDVDALLERVLDLIFEAVPARRGFILSRFSEFEEPVVRAGRTGDGSDELPMSKTMIDHVFASKTAVLTANAQDDPRFRSAESIFGHGVQAAMCVPMCAGRKLTGAIYVDTDRTGGSFSEHDLEMLTALGRVVGMAVENFRLNQERVEHERLAAIGAAIAGIGHCMKNILTGLKASSEFISMAESREDWNWLRDGWGTMQKALSRFEHVLNDLLTYSGKMELNLEAVNLNDLVEEIIENVRPRAKRRKIEIEFDRESVSPIEVDPHQIYRVLLNLAENAMDACKNGGRIELACWENTFGAYLQVRDNGEGIPAENMPRIAHAFFTTKGHGGTGLGLACAYRIVELHRGRITVESEPGRGAAFTVFFPRKTAQVQVLDDSTLG